MPWWVLALLGWVAAIPVVTVVCIGVLRGGRLDDEARLAALARRRADGGQPLRRSA
jgi:hypothetical protein